MRGSPFLLTTLCLAAAPAYAKPIDFSAVIEGHAGYGINPRLDTDRSSGAASGRVRFSPMLTAETSVSQTTLQGDYQREQYTNSYGHSQSVSGTLSHDQALSEHLQTAFSAGYFRSNNILLNDTIDPGLLGDIASSQKLWRAQATGSVTWQMSARDQISGGVNYAHEVADFFTSQSNYDQYGANFTYLRTLNARTKVGLRMNVSRFKTQIDGDSTSLSPSVVVHQRLSAIWQLDADVGVIIQRSGTPADVTSKGLGFHATLRGTYPRSSICLTVGRDNSATAFNGVRRELIASARYSYRLTELSTISARASFLHNDSNSFIAASSTVVRGDIEYDRKLTQRLSAGVEGRGGYRKSLNGSGKSISGSAYVRFQIG